MGLSGYFWHKNQNVLLTSSYGLGILQIKFFSVIISSITSSVHKIVRHYIANAANAVRSLTFV